MTAAIYSGAGAERNPSVSDSQSLTLGKRFMRVLEAHATAILVITVALSALLLLDGYANVSGNLLGNSPAANDTVPNWSGASVTEAAGQTGSGLAAPASGLFPAYSFKTLVVIAHVLGLVLSFGAVMFLDLFLLRYLLFRPVPGHAYEVASFGSTLVIAGLAVMWMTGLTFLLIYWAVDPVKLDNPKVLAKVIVVALLSINGILIHNKVLPILKSKVGRKILEDESAAKCRMILATGAISFTSWMFAVVLGLSKELNFTVSGASLLLAYALLNAAVFIGMNGMVSVCDKLQGPERPIAAPKRPQSLVLGANLRTLL